MSIIFCAVSFFFSCAADAYGEEALAARFQREAPPAWKVYRDWAKRLQGTMATRLDVNGSPHSKSDLQIKQNATSSLVLVQRYLFSDRPAIGTQGDVSVSNPGYAFALRRPAENQEWSIAGIAGVGTDSSHSIVEASSKSADVACVMLKLTNGRALDELVAQPSFRVLEVKSIVKEGADYVEIHFDNSHPIESKPFMAIQRGVALLDPAQSWCLRSAVLECQYGTGPDTVSVEHEYRPGLDGFPIPERVIERGEGFNEEDGKHDPFVTSYEAHYALTIPSQFPADDEFTLSAFGFPEPNAPGKNRLLLIGIMIAGLVLVVSGVLLRQRIAIKTQRGASS